MKKVFLLLICSMSAFSICKSQTVKYLNRYGTPGIEGVYGIVCDHSGNNYMIGRFSDSLNFGNGVLLGKDHTFTDLFLVKSDSLGNVIWAKSFGSSDSTRIGPTDNLNGLSIDSQGNLYVGGALNQYDSVIFDTITISANNLPSGNLSFISKFDSSGRCKWVKITNNYEDKFTTDDQNRISAVNGGTITTLDSLGDSLWTKSYNCVFTDLYYDKNHFLYCTGSISNTTFDTTSITLHGLSDFFIAKIDTLGNVVWIKNEGGADENSGYSIAGYDSITYVLGVYSDEITFDTTTLSSNGNFFLAAYDNDLGNLQWVQPIRASAYNTGTAAGRTGLAVSDSQEIFVLFHTGGYVYAGRLFLSLSGVESVIIKYANSGVPAWAIRSNTQTQNDDISTQTQQIYCDHFQHLYMAGLFTGQMAIRNSGDPGNAISDTISSVNYTNSDIFCAMLNTQNDSSAAIDTTHTGIITLMGDQSLSVYPNPTKDVVNIFTSADDNTSPYFILDEAGDRIMTGKLAGKCTQLDLRQLAAGLYYVQVGTVFKKIVKL